MTVQIFMEIFRTVFEEVARIFEDMDHGITINREFEKLKLHICTLGLRSSKIFVSNVKVFVSDVICKGLFRMCLCMSLF